MLDAETERREHNFLIFLYLVVHFVDRVFSNPLESRSFVASSNPLSSPFSCPLSVFLSFVALHGPLSSLFQPLGVPSRTPCPTFGGSLSSLLQPLSGPWRIEPPTPSWPFAVLRGPSWISFCLFVEILFCPLIPRPLADPSRAFSNPLVALPVLRGPSWISFCPSCPFVDPLRGYLFSSCPFVSIRGSSCPLVDPFVDNRDNVPSLQAAPGTSPHLC